MTSKAYKQNYDLIDWKPVKVVASKRQVSSRPFHIIKDLEPYRSPITDEVIRSRSHHREHMRDHNVIEMGNEKPKQRQPVKMPDAREDVKAAMEQVASGYRPRPLQSQETF